MESTWTGHSGGGVRERLMLMIVGVGAEFQRMTKMVHKNEGKMKVKMRIFAKWGGMVHFSKNPSGAVVVQHIILTT